MIDEENIDNVKITLLGSAGVGKTCIISRYANDIFLENPMTTDSVNYSQKVLTINEKIIKLDIWDTAGQERYRSLGKHYYRDSYIVCLVYDITNLKSFEDIKNIWYNDLKLYGEKYTIVAIVGNKSDCYEQEKVNEEDAKAYAKEIGAFFQLVSAKEGVGINELFNNLVRLYLGEDFFPKVEEMKSEKNSRNNSIIEKKDLKKKKKKCCNF